MTDILIDDPHLNPQYSPPTTLDPPWMHLSSALDNTGASGWADFLAETTAFSSGGSGRVEVETAGMPADKYRKVSFVQGVLDLRDYAMLTFTNVDFNFSFLGMNLTGSHHKFWTNDAAAGIGLVTQLDDGDGRNLTSALTDYEFEMQGAYDAGVTELAPRLPYSTMPTGYGAYTWTLNADGLAYLNGSSLRTIHPGYMFFTIAYGGIIDGVTPDLWATDSEMRVDVGILEVNMTYAGGSQPIQINVSDAWKDVTRVYINTTGASWKEVSAPQINVGDAWKDAA